TIHMAFRREVHYRINMVILQNGFHHITGGNIPLFKAIITFIVHRRKVIQIPGIGELVVGDDIVIRVFIHHIAHKGTTNESCPTRYEDIFHSAFSSSFSATGSAFASSVSVVTGASGLMRTNFSSASATPSTSCPRTT